MHIINTYVPQNYFVRVGNQRKILKTLPVTQFTVLISYTQISSILTAGNRQDFLPRILEKNTAIVFSVDSVTSFLLQPSIQFHDLPPRHNSIHVQGNKNDPLRDWRQSGTGLRRPTLIRESILARLVECGNDISIRPFLAVSLGRAWINIRQRSVSDDID